MTSLMPLNDCNPACHGTFTSSPTTNLCSVILQRQVTAIEHGEKALAPFLGREYAGAPAIRSYFETIGSLLSYEEMEFVEFVVDSHSRRVACKARAKFTWKSTGESWEEKFAYMLDFDDEKKITDYQVWADSGAAYLARIGKLDEVRKAEET